jgi:hypothetical protein
MITSLNQERFDLNAWIGCKLGLNTERKYHKERLEELIEAFDRAGFRTRELVESLDKEAIEAINSKLPEEKKLEVGEIRALSYKNSNN